MNKRLLLVISKAAISMCLVVGLGLLAAAAYAKHRAEAAVTNVSNQIPATLVGSYRRYLNDVATDIVDHRTGTPQSAEETVCFRLYKDGEVSDLRFADVTSKSDPTTISAMAAATPFNPPPADCPETLDVRVAVKATSTAI